MESNLVNSTEEHLGTNAIAGSDSADKKESSTACDTSGDLESYLDSNTTGVSGLTISQEEIDEILKKQDSRKVSAFEAGKLDRDAKKNWDIFYKRNETRFFKDRHWTLREFEEILSRSSDNKEETENDKCDSPIVLLEIGCGVGNFAFPILEVLGNLKVWACDFSPRAIDLVKSNPAYDEERIRAFVCDITEGSCFSSNEFLVERKPDFISLIFVLSAISPEKFEGVVKNLIDASKSGTVICFRDYGRYDMAQLRFKGGKKIKDNFYARRDGTRAYYFTPEEVSDLFTASGHFKLINCDYVHRRTVNLKEQVDVGRIFVQGKFIRV
ncbi:unnamed protein product [Allacma fusca]|uniref:tRNA N(3)-methylcytidine methyltransferase n=1 Tax=Allacma fusca TaxID=39272 RepID=A0A8J2NJW7_9HEXA|nr:unnamed protein product [Allacma fusca]